MEGKSEEETQNINIGQQQHTMLHNHAIEYTRPGVPNLLQVGAHLKCSQMSGAHRGPPDK